MGSFASMADRNDIEAEAPWEARPMAGSLYALLCETTARHAAQSAFSFQLTSGPTDPAETLTWTELKAKVTQTANLFRALGIGPGDVVAYVLPNTTETAVTLIAGAVAGIVNPINPLLDAAQIAAILRETKAKVVVTLRAFPKTDIAGKVAEAVAHAPGVHTVLEVDLNRYLAPPKKWSPKKASRDYGENACGRISFRLPSVSTQSSGRMPGIWRLCLWCWAFCGCWPLAACR